MKPVKRAGPWVVEIAPDAIREAQRAIERHYNGTKRRDMQGWLARFIKEVHDDPMGVLGSPPLAAASDPDLLFFPGDRHKKVGGLAHASKIRHVIHVYEIVVAMPGDNP